MKKDFIDVVDNMYHDQMISEELISRSKPCVNALKKQPISDQYSSHVIKKQPISDQYSSHVIKSKLMCDRYSLSDKENKILSGGRKRMKNRQFYLRKEWLK